MEFTEQHLRNLKSKQTQDKRANTILQNSRKKIKKCSICGKEFHPVHHNQTICKDVHYFPCPICGKPVEYINSNRQRCCSSLCLKEKKKRTNLKKYGVEYASKNEKIKEKTKRTNIERYGYVSPFSNKDIQLKYKNTMIKNHGVDNPMKLESCQEKARHTCLEKYGVDYVSKSEDVKQKIAQTNMKRFGVPVCSMSPEVKAKTVETNMKRYGVPYTTMHEGTRAKMNATNIKRYGSKCAFSSPEVRDKISKTIMKKYGVPWYVMSDECKKINGRIVSTVNKRFSYFLHDNGVSHAMEYRVGLKSYDFKIDNSNILIELDPTASHNDYINLFSGVVKESKNPDYQLEKTKVAEQNGYRCIHVFDWDNWDDVLTLILPTIHVYARNCNIVSVSKADADKFINENHIKGTCKGQSIRVGLQYKDELIQIMTFGKPRYNNNYQYELLRLCTKQKYNVVGGASKLYKHAKLLLNGKVISYCDRSKFNGNVYRNIGMRFVRSTAPSKIWSKDSKYITDNLLRQRGFDQLFNTNYGKGTINEELMWQHKWLPVYDCGQLVFEDEV